MLNSKKITIIVLFAFTQVEISASFSHYTIARIPTERDKCENVDNFLKIIETLHAPQAFYLLSVPLTARDVPLALNDIREKLTQAIVSDTLNIDLILKDLKNIEHLNRFEMLITTLMAINEYGNANCYFQTMVNKALFYLLKKKYLYKNDYSLSNEFGTCNKNDCHYQNPIIQFLQNSVSSAGCVSSIEKPQQMGKKLELKKKIKQPPVLPDLLSLIPQPSNPEEATKYQQLKLLLESDQVRKIIQSLQGEQNSSVVLDKILTILKTDPSNVQNHELLNYFTNHRETAQDNFNFSSLMSVLPKPQNNEEIFYLQQLQHLLTGNKIYNDLKDLKFDNDTKLENILLLVMEKLMTVPTISKDIKNALRHYLPIISAKKKNIIFSKLVELLPEPASPQEQIFYDLFREFLQSHEIYGLMHNVETMSEIQDDPQLLQLVLREAIKSKGPKAEAAKFYRDKQATMEFGFNYFDLILNGLNSLENTTQHLATIEDYLYTPEFKTFLKHSNFTESSVSNDLEQVLRKLQEVVQKPQIVGESIEHYLRLLELSKFQRKMVKIVNLLPPPSTPEEKIFYEIVTNFLISEQCYTLLKSVDFSLFSDGKHLLEYILRAVIDLPGIATNIKEAFQFYLEWSEHLIELEFVTKKEIKKNFKLTTIFTDTLDLKSLTLPEKNAFRKFFKYISEIDPQVMSRFVSWDQATTRGEFMKLLFKYFLDMKTVPDEIKKSIQMLDGLVKMDGKGALPP